MTLKMTLTKSQGRKIDGLLPEKVCSGVCFEDCAHEHPHTLWKSNSCHEH